MIDRQDVFFDYTFRQTLTKFLYSISCKNKKNSDSQASEKDNLVKIIPENQMVGALSPICLAKLI